MLTLTGAGGVGKTRLALEFAKGLPGRYARVDLIELDSLHDDAPLAQSVATALGVGERAGRSGTDALVRAIGNTSRLVILDNCLSRCSRTLPVGTAGSGLERRRLGHGHRSARRAL
ncbi:hypothetical protein [Streptomyces sp. NBC_01483]|uniref:hypothetical protein n=1 Tax=Streptomyces sp. NBC_01483 TaxID=2903883 RepID=UPI002E381B4D|nr:hypothetical protein [Streptomyces sp. NBC_01483]